MAILESPSACIAAEEGVIAKAVLMPGDPLRAKFVAGTIWKNRCASIPCGICWAIPAPIRVGNCPSWVTAWAFPLRDCTPTSCITSTAWTPSSASAPPGHRKDVKVRDVVLAMGASTNSHFADQYRFPGQLCATADYGLLKDAAAAAERLGVRADVGQVFTSDQFYNDNPEANATYRKFGILAVEMETAGIYWTAQRASASGRCLSLPFLTIFLPAKP